MPPTDEDYRLLAQLYAEGGGGTISGNQSRSRASRLVDLKLVVARSLTVGTIQYEITELGRAALVLNAFGIRDLTFRIEPHRNASDGLWYIKVSTERNPPQLITPNVATNLISMLRARAALKVARRFEAELHRLIRYSR